MASARLARIGAALAVVVFVVYQLAAPRDSYLLLRRPFLPAAPPAAGDVPSLRTYGAHHCMGPLNATALALEAAAVRASCGRASPPRSSLAPGGPRIATLSVHFAPTPGADAFYRTALRSHLLHGLVHRSSLHLLCSPVVDGMWNKQAFVLAVLLAELAKPPADRLQWLFWADRDTLILDHCRDPADFLDPAADGFLDPAADDVRPSHRTNLLIANDLNGLNAGVFLVRVDKWSVDLFSDVLAFPRYKPHVDLPFSEQTALKKLLKDDRYKDNVRYAPQHWFNAYPKGESHAADFVTREHLINLEDWTVRRGDFLVHFAGSSNKKADMQAFAEAARRVGNVWESGRAQRDVSTEVRDFWADKMSTTE